MLCCDVCLKVLLGDHLRRIARWLVAVSRAVLPFHRSYSKEEEKAQQSVQEEEEYQAHSGQVSFEKAAQYQKEHNWVYDDSLVGKRGHYDY